MAEAQPLKTVQEPEDNLLLAPTKPTTPGQFYLVTKLMSQINVAGQPQKFTQPEDGIIGFMLVFDDYEKALKWANGDSSIIMAGYSKI